MKTLTCYLAGSIRDNNEEDIDWRERFICKLGDYVHYGHLSILSPLAGKKLENGIWSCHNVLCDSDFVINADFWAVDHADIGIFNFLPLAENYPTIGTLVEFGRSTSRSMLRFAIVKDKFTGHKNEVFADQVHPFIKSQTTAVFGSTDECALFLNKHLPVLLGVDPRYELRKQDDALLSIPIDKFFKV